MRGKEIFFLTALLCLAAADAELHPHPRRRRLEFHQFKKVLHSEVHQEFDVEEQDLFREAADFEWRRAIRREQRFLRRLQEGAIGNSTATFSEPKHFQKKTGFIVCDDNSLNTGVGRGQEVRTFFGVSAVETLYNHVDMSCFLVFSEASKAMRAPRHLAVEALPSSGRMHYDLRSLASEAALENFMAPVGLSLGLCPGVIKPQKGSARVVDEMEELAGSFREELGAELLSRRRLSEEFFWYSERKETNKTRAWSRALQTFFDDADSVCAEAALETLQPVYHHRHLDHLILDKWPNFLQSIAEKVAYGSEDYQRKLKEACSLSVLAFFATRHEVCHISFEEKISYDTASSTSVVQGGGKDPAYRLFWDSGIHGENQIITIADTGVDIFHCHYRDDVHGPIKPTVCLKPTSSSTSHICRDVATWDFSQRKIVQYVNYSDFTDLANGHGTHVAGCAVASLSDSAVTEYDGVAPFAKLAVFDTQGAGGGLPYYQDEYIGVGYEAGSRVFSASWSAGSNSYSSTARRFDRFAYEQPDMLILSSSGNSGEYWSGAGSGQQAWGDYAVRVPAICKNVLGVGASCNTDNCGSIDQIADFSSQGPAFDLRRKPDIAGPGSQITAARASGVWESETCDLRGASGTSMAAPTVAGAALLVRQWFTDGFGTCTGWASGASGGSTPCSPTAATMKAAMINSAAAATDISQYRNNITEQDQPSEQPDYFQGHGIILLSNALKLSGANSIETFVNEGSITEGATDTFDILATGGTFSVTLAWTDPPAAKSCAVCIINDLDVFVEDVTAGITYNAGPAIFPDPDQDDGIYGPPAAEHRPPSTSMADRDAINTIERITVPNVISGRQYTVSVTGQNLDAAYPSQAYSIVASGTIADPNAVSLTPGPTPSPSRLPTDVPSKSPTKNPATLAPTVAPTTAMPTRFPTTLAPTVEPSTETVTGNPTTLEPTKNPTKRPTENPTQAPTADPTTLTPTKSPTTAPPTEPGATLSPSRDPTLAPTASPTTLAPTAEPTTSTPTKSPTTLSPSGSPTTSSPTGHQTILTPTTRPTTLTPTKNPATLTPTSSPTRNLTTAAPTIQSTLPPSTNPSNEPSTPEPSSVPSVRVPTARECPPTCPLQYQSDRFCDAGCNIQLCNWDDGDCCVETNPNNWGGEYDCKDPQHSASPTNNPTTSAPTIPSPTASMPAIASPTASAPPTGAPSTFATTSPTSLWEPGDLDTAVTRATGRMCRFHAELYWLSDDTSLEASAEFYADALRISLDATMRRVPCEDAVHNSNLTLWSEDEVVIANEVVAGEPLGYKAAFQLLALVDPSGSGDKNACASMGYELLDVTAEKSPLGLHYEETIAQLGLATLGNFSSEEVSPNDWFCRCSAVSAFPTCLRPDSDNEPSKEGDVTGAAVIIGLVLGFTMSAMGAAYGTHLYTTRKAVKAFKKDTPDAQIASVTIDVHPNSTKVTTSESLRPTDECSATTVTRSPMAFGPQPPYPRPHPQLRRPGPTQAELRKKRRESIQFL